MNILHVDRIIAPLKLSGSFSKFTWLFSIINKHFPHINGIFFWKEFMMMTESRRPTLNQFFLLHSYQRIPNDGIYS